MFRPKLPINQESALLDHVERLRKDPAGRRAAHIRLSALRPYTRQDYRLYIARAAFDPLQLEFDAAIFHLFNDDLVVICTDADIEDIDQSVLHLRFLFSEDPLLKDDEDGRQPFCTWFDLAADYEDLSGLARSMVTARETQDSRAPLSEEIEDSTLSVKPLDPPNLTVIQEAIALADLSTMIRKQPVCAVVGGRKPQAVFHEIYTSIESLRRSLVPNIDLHANRWLFQALTEQLDGRMIDYLAQYDDPSLRQPFSINLNVSTLLSPGFLEFGETLINGMRGNIVIELQLVDVYSDLGNFLFARDFFRERGFMFCLDGITHLSLPLIDREVLGCDLVKLLWRIDLCDQLTGVRRDQLLRAAQKIDPKRLILARCDSEQALEVGRALGIALYQGRLIDSLLHQATTREQSSPGQDPPASDRMALTR